MSAESVTIDGRSFTPFVEGAAKGYQCACRARFIYTGPRLPLVTRIAMKAHVCAVSKLTPAQATGVAVHARLAADLAPVSFPPPPSPPDCAECGDVQAGTRKLDGDNLCETCLIEAVAPPAWKEILAGLERIARLDGFDVDEFDDERADGPSGIDYVKTWIAEAVAAIEKLVEDQKTLESTCDDLDLENDASDEVIHDAIEELRARIPVPSWLSRSEVELALAHADPERAVAQLLRRSS